MIKKRKTKCPHCNTLHEYSEVRFSFKNDFGYWKIKCRSCTKIFGMKILNPAESSMSQNFLVAERIEGEPGSDLVLASDVVEYTIDLNNTYHEYDYDAVALYKCQRNGSNLETLAIDALEASFPDLQKQYGSAVNYCLANRTPDYEFVVAQVDFSCSCGSNHRAMFYSPFYTNGYTPQNPKEFLLADVDGASLATELTGIFTKTEIMSFLEKLIIRWNLRAISIVIASPFVGHQYLSKEDKLSIWNWLLTKLDHKKAFFITRSHTLNSYKSLISDQDGLSYELLKEYDLENRVVSANTKKNDFHAKFFAGLGSDTAEILSGSANLVHGPSMENSSFQSGSRETFEKRYWAPLKVKKKLHEVKARHWIECAVINGRWCTRPKSGTEI